MSTRPKQGDQLTINFGYDGNARKLSARTIQRTVKRVNQDGSVIDNTGEPWRVKRTSVGWIAVSLFILLVGCSLRNPVVFDTPKQLKPEKQSISEDVDEYTPVLEVLTDSGCETKEFKSRHQGRIKELTVTCK